jgi:hypothetical protein
LCKLEQEGSPRQRQKHVRKLGPFSFHANDLPSELFHENERVLGVQIKPQERDETIDHPIGRGITKFDNLIAHTNPKKRDLTKNKFVF